MHEDQRKRDCRNPLLADRRVSRHKGDRRAGGQDPVRKHRDRRWHHRRTWFMMDQYSKEDWSERGRRQIARRRTDPPVM